MLNRIIISSIFLILLLKVSAQLPVGTTSSEIFSDIQKLKVLGSVLYVAAHPDDENTRLLAFLAREKKYRTGYLSMTRGDGGQNLIGDEQGIELGLIRTQELLAARRIDGAEQFFTRAFDFGYSKNPEETLEKWGKEKILADVVWVIRNFKPDVIITRFPETGEGGHGHHTTSAILAREAFLAAADPSKFPDQLKYVSVWKPERLLWNTFRFGNVNTTSDDQFKIDVGGYNALLGASYGEISALSRSQHKSQGFGVPASRGEALEYFTTISGTQPKIDLFDNIPAGWDRIPGGVMITTAIADILKKFNHQHPERSVKGLVDLYKLVKKLPDGYWRNQKLKEIQKLIVKSAGLYMDAYTNKPFVAQTDSVAIQIAFNDRTGAGAMLHKLIVNGFDTTVNTTLGTNSNVVISKTLYVPVSKPVTQPYWLQNEKADGYYNVKDQQLIGQPDALPAFTTQAHIRIGGETFIFELPVRYRYTDPVKGELYQSFIVIPPVTATADEMLKISRDGNQFNGVLNLTNHTNGGHYELTKVISQNNKSVKQTMDPASIHFTAREKSSEVLYALNSDTDDSYVFTWRNEKDTLLKPLKEWRTISYDHIPAINYFKDVQVNNYKLDLKIAGKHIGYIPGAGDKVPEALLQMGYQVTLLNEKELAQNHLEVFDAIITGVRAYNTNEWLNKYYQKLMKYIENGGNLVVQYNTSSNLGPVKALIGPYAFNISRTRITDENAPVRFLKPHHRALNFPNKITKSDFENWVQERSIYHAADLGSEFETIIAMNDPGEPAESGSLAIAKYGKGTFVYTGLVFFRQLPAGVPGAYRLLANLIALNQDKIN